MGKINQGILGGFSGKVGTVVGSTWKSINYMRALAVSVHNPNTAKQQCQRGKFKTVMQFCKTITPFLRVGFQEYEHGQSAVNAASSYLLRNAVEGCGDEAALDFDKVRVSQGSLTVAADAGAEVAGNMVTFTWTDNSGTGDAQEADAAMVLAYNKDRQEAAYNLAAATRADGTAELALPTSWSGDAMAVYLGFCSEDGQHVSNSLCLKNDALSTEPEDPDSGEDDEEEEGGNQQMG